MFRKVTPDMIKKIMKVYEEEKLSMVRISERFGLSEGYAGQIIRKEKNKRKNKANN